MSKSRDRITYIVTGAIIAALYVDLTFLSNIFNLAYGQIQFRVSEVLTILPNIYLRCDSRAHNRVLYREYRVI